MERELTGIYFRVKRDDKYKLSHYKDTKILEVFEVIPEWATSKMIERYEEFKAE